MIQTLRVEGRIGARAPFLAQIVADRGGRPAHRQYPTTLESCCAAWIMSAACRAGSCRCAGAVPDDAQPDRPLIGTANIEQFRIRDAPAFGKLLQAMTLYARSGGGVAGFWLGLHSELVAPFRLTDSALGELTPTLGRSANQLGLTAKGRLDLYAQTIDLQGDDRAGIFLPTHCWGKSRWWAKLFSPERGGGVFAASYAAARSAGGPERIGQSAGRR